MPAPLVLVNAVGLTSRLLSHARRLAATAARSRAGRHLHGAGDASHRTALGATRHRRQRLAVPRHWRSALLAAVQSTRPSGAALPDRAPAGEGTRRNISLRQALLVVQPGR